MRETIRDEKFPNDPKPVEVLGELRDSGPGLQDVLDVLMLQTAILMRLYDVNMALLNEVDEERADAVFDRHADGGHFNPPTMVPVFSRVDEKEEDAEGQDEQGTD